MQRETSALWYKGSVVALLYPQACANNGVFSMFLKRLYTKCKVMWDFCLSFFCYLPTMLISAIRWSALFPSGYLYVPYEGDQLSYLNRSHFKNVSNETQLKHHSALTVQTPKAITASGLWEEEILGPLHTRTELQHCVCWIGLKDKRTIIILFLQQFSPTVSSTMKYPPPQRQYNMRGLSCALHSPKTHFQPPNHKWNFSRGHKLSSIYVLASSLGLWWSMYYTIHS